MTTDLPTTMNTSMLTLYGSLLICAAYLLGSLSSAIVYCRMAGLPDPRSRGSGNPGATNVLRIGGKRAAAVVLLGDALKGWIPVAIGTLAGFDHGTVALVGLAAFLGHLFPIFFAFRGGKGVATALGVCIGLSPWLGVLLVSIWLIIAYAFRISSLAALCSALAAPLCAWWLLDEPRLAAAVGTMSVLLIWRHRSNISKLLAGTEGKIGRS